MKDVYELRKEINYLYVAGWWSSSRFHSQFRQNFKKARNTPLFCLLPWRFLTTSHLSPSPPPQPPSNITTAFVGAVFSNDNSSILARTKDLRLGRVHIGFPDLLIEQGDRTTIDASEKTNGATGKSDTGDAEGIG